MTEAHGARTAVLEVLDPGFLATIQDGGRTGLAGEGITRGGAADTWSLAVANAVVGNPASAAAVEVTLVGPRLRALRTATVGLAGSFAATIDETGERTEPGGAVVVREGMTLVFEPAAAGARGYLAVPGGIDVPLVLGSRSTALGAGFGGFGGRALAAGDRLAAAGGPLRLAPPPGRWPGPGMPSTGPVRILPGPHASDAGSGALAALVAQPWTVDAASDRVGLRLRGRAMSRTTGELASHGVVAGAIQLPPDGSPIVLLVDHQPTGGYPVIAVVITADLPRLGQLVPGGQVTFTVVDEASARAALQTAVRSFEEALAHLSDAARWDDLWHGAGG